MNLSYDPPQQFRHAVDQLHEIVALEVGSDDFGPGDYLAGLKVLLQSMDYDPLFSEQGRHIAYLVSEAMAREARTVEPSAEGEADWVKTIKENLLIDKQFWEGCTPGYNNNEGLEVERYTIFGEPYGPGYDAFDDLIREWRDEGGMAGMELGE